MRFTEKAPAGRAEEFFRSLLEPVGRSWGVVALLAFGCHSVVELDDPTVDPSLMSALYIVRAEGMVRGIGVTTADGQGPPKIPAGTVSEGTELAVVYYRATREDLFFELLDDPDRASRPTRPVPAFDAGFQKRLGDGAWRPLLLDELRDVRLPAPSELECIERDGCYPTALAAAELDCKVPCQSEVTRQVPTLPSPPDLGACLPGWSRRTEPPLEGLVLSVCEPPLTLACGPTEAQWVDASSCAVVGSACPAGWPSDLPPGRPRFYVAPGAPPGGTGTPSAPYNSLEAAVMAGAGLDPVLVLGPGSHRLTQPLELGDGVLLRGACASGTAIEGAPHAALLIINGAGIEIEDLELRPGRGGQGVYAGVGASVRILDTVISGPTAFGALIEAGAELDMERVLVRTATVVGVQLFGRGRLRQVAIEDGGKIGLRVEGGRGDIQGLVVRGLRPSVAGFSACVASVSGAELLLEDALLEDCPVQGIQFFLARGELRGITIRDPIVSPVPAPGDPRPSIAMGIYSFGSGFSLDRVHVDRASSYGLLLERSTVWVSNLVVERSISPPGLSPFGFGLFAGSSRLSLDRAWIRQSGASGLVIAYFDESDITATSTLADVIVEDSARAIDNSGEGLAFGALNEASVERALITGSARRSLMLAGGSRVRASDVTVVRGGIGVRIDDDSDLVLTRAVVGGPSAGVCVTSHGSAHLEDVWIDRADVGASDDQCGLLSSSGAGLLLTDFATLDARNLLISSSDRAGITFAKPDTLKVDNVLIENNGIGLRAPPEYLRGVFVRARFAGNSILFVPAP